MFGQDGLALALRGLRGVAVPSVGFEERVELLLLLRSHGADLRVLQDAPEPAGQGSS